jgi:hydrogenase maturation protease
MQTLILGLGNPILCDDGVGIRVARELAARVISPAVSVVETSGSGLSLVDILTGYHKAILVDAIITGRNRPGQILRLSVDDINATLHSTSLHDISLGQALELGKSLGAAMPEEIVIYGIEVSNVDTFSETCTPLVEQAIAECVSQIIAELNQ